MVLTRDNLACRRGGFYFLAAATTGERLWAVRVLAVLGSGPRTAVRCAGWRLTLQVRSPARGFGDLQRAVLIVLRVGVFLESSFSSSECSCFVWPGNWTGSRQDKAAQGQASQASVRLGQRGTVRTVRTARRRGTLLVRYVGPSRSVLCLRTHCSPAEPSRDKRARIEQSGGTSNGLVKWDCGGKG